MSEIVIQWHFSKLQFIIVMTGVSYTPAGYNGKDFPGWAEGLGWMMVAVPIVLILAGMAIQLIRSGGSVSTCHIMKTCLHVHVYRALFLWL